jgi:cytochrome P450
LVLALIGVVRHDSSIWSEPQRLDPARFTEARAEVKSFWHAMLTRCRFTIADKYRGHPSYYAPAGIVSGDVKLRIERL